MQKLNIVIIIKNLYNYFEIIIKKFYNQFLYKNKNKIKNKNISRYIFYFYKKYAIKNYLYNKFKCYKI